MLNNTQLERERLNKDLEEEHNKSRILLQEKRELELNLLNLEKLNDTHLSQIREMEGNMKAIEVDKLEIEKKYLSENVHNSELKRLYEECLEKSKCFKMESEENLLALRQTIEELECKYTDLLKRMEEEKQRNTVLSSSLQNAEDDKRHLNTLILEANAELSSFENLKNDYKDLEEKMSQLLEEKIELNLILGNTKDALSKCKSECENILKLYEEKNEEFLKIKEEYEAKMVSELETIKTCLEKTEEELSQQRRNTNDIKKMLYESEKISNDDRISKQKEIIQYKNQLRKLENEIVLKYVEREMFDVLSSENTKLKKDLEEIEIKLQKVECLNASLNKKAVKLDKSPKIVMMAKSPKQTIITKSPKQSIVDMNNKQEVVEKSSKQAILDKSFEKAKSGKSPKQVMKLNEGNNFVPKARKNEELSKMIAVKIQNKKVQEKDLTLTTSANTRSKKSASCNYESEQSKLEEAESFNQDFCFEKKISGKENKAWDADSSSGSEYLDISYFQKTEAATTKKECFAIQDNLKDKLNRFLPSSQQKRESQANISDNNMAKRQCMPHKTQKQFKSSIWTPQALRTLEKTSQDMQVAEQARKNNKRNTPFTPTNTTQRRFFKTPLLERDNKFKKPLEPWI